MVQNIKKKHGLGNVMIVIHLSKNSVKSFKINDTFIKVTYIISMYNQKKLTKGKRKGMR